MIDAATKTIHLDPETARMLAEVVGMTAARLGVSDRDISESVIVWRAIHMMWQAEQEQAGQHE